LNSGGAFSGFVQIFQKIYFKNYIFYYFHNGFFSEKEYDVNNVKEDRLWTQ